MQYNQQTFTLHKCVYSNEYNFEEILKDINGYGCNSSVIMSSIRIQLNWNNIQSDAFYCILKFVLTTEIFNVINFDDELLVKYALDILEKLYDNSSTIDTNYLYSEKSINNSNTHQIVDIVINNLSLDSLHNYVNVHAARGTSKFEIGDKGYHSFIIDILNIADQLNNVKDFFDSFMVHPQRIKCLQIKEFTYLPMFSLTIRFKQTIPVVRNRSKTKYRLKVLSHIK